MTCSFSQGYLEAVAGKVTATITGTGIALVDGGGSADTITDTGNGFVAAGFAVGDAIYLKGQANAANDGPFVLTAVAAGTLTFSTASLAAGETAGNSITVWACKRAGFADLFWDSELIIFEGSIPSSADATEGSAKVLVDWTGVKFGTPTWDSTNKHATVDLLAGLTLSVNATAGGTANWYRLYSNPKVTGASTTAIRIDGTVGVGTSYDLSVGNTAVVSGAPQSLSSFAFDFPQVAA